MVGQSKETVAHSPFFQKVYRHVAIQYCIVTRLILSFLDVCQQKSLIVPIVLIQAASIPLAALTVIAVHCHGYLMRLRSADFLRTCSGPL